MTDELQAEITARVDDVIARYYMPGLDADATAILRAMLTEAYRYGRIDGLEWAKAKIAA